MPSASAPKLMAWSSASSASSPQLTPATLSSRSSFAESQGIPSRRSSIAASDESHRSKKARRSDDFQRRHKISNSSKIEKHNIKAKDERTEIADITQDQEDILEILAGLVINSSLGKSNRRKSGLKNKKMAIHVASLELLECYLEPRVKQLFDEGKDPGPTISRELHEHRLRKANGETLVTPPVSRCRNVTDGNECVVHGRPDWIACRKARFQASLNQNLARYEEQR